MSAIRLINIGTKQLGIDIEDARDLYEAQTGVRSLRAMTPAQREAVLGELKRLGFKPHSSGARRRLEGKYAGKLQALWIAAWNLGVVDHRDDAALIAFVKRQAGIDHVRFLHDPVDARAAIEGLKRWLAREAGVDWTTGRHLPDWTQVPGYRIAAAQLEILRGLDPAYRVYGSLATAIAVRVDRRLAPPKMTDRDWIAVMNTFGGAIRAARK